MLKIKFKICRFVLCFVWGVGVGWGVLVDTAWTLFEVDLSFKSELDPAHSYG